MKSIQMCQVHFQGSAGYLIEWEDGKKATFLVHYCPLYKATAPEKIVAMTVTTCKSNGL